MSKKIPIDNKIAILKAMSDTIYASKMTDEKETIDFFSKKPHKYVEIKMQIIDDIYNIFDEIIKDLRSKKNALLYLKTMEETEDTYELEKILKGE